MRSAYFTPPLRLVVDNYFQISQTLSKITWESGVETTEAFTLSDDDTISVFLVSRDKSYRCKDVAVSDSTLSFVCNGIDRCGLYGVDIKIVLSDGTKLHSFQPDKILIVDNNYDAGIPDSDELGVETYTIDGTCVLYAKGDPGLSAYEVYVANVEDGETVMTEEEWLESLQGDASVDLSDYYTKDECDATFLTSTSLEDYYTKDECDAAFLTEHQSLDDYYTKTEADSTFLTSTSLEDYYTKDECDAAFLTEHQSLDDYYTKDECDELIGDLQTIIDAL